MTPCPIFPNRNLRKDGTCTRYHLCLDEHIKVCKARLVGPTRPVPYSRKPSGAGCLHKYTTTVPTPDKVVIDGEEKRVFEVICKECGYTRRMIL